MKNHYEHRSQYLNGNEYKHSPELSSTRKLTGWLILLSGAMILVGVLGTKLFPEIAAGLTLVGVMLFTGIAVSVHMVKG